MKRQLLSTCLASLALVVSCAQEQPLLVQVQPNYLDKTFFVGANKLNASDDPEFYSQGTLVDVGYGAGQDGLFTSTYAQYKWQPKQSAVPTSFYAFGDCFALISFAHETPPYVVLLKTGPFAQVFRQAFNTAWENAHEPPKHADHKHAEHKHGEKR